MQHRTRRYRRFYVSGVLRTLSLFGLLIVSLTGDQGGGLGAERFPERERPVSFVSAGQTVHLLLATDEIGVTVRAGVTQTDIIRRFAPPPALFIPGVRTPIVPIMKLSNRVYLLEPRRSSRRDSLTDLAPEIKKLNPMLFDRVGLALRGPGSDTPMILTDEIVVQFRDHTSQAEIEEFITKEALEVIRAGPVIRTRYLFRDPAGPSVSLLKKVSGYDRKKSVDFAYPNFVVVHHPTQQWPNDKFFPLQWSLENTGLKFGTDDADVDAAKAWRMTRGDQRVVIAVIDDGFEWTHPDLEPNLWGNVDEIGKTVDSDDDGNGCVDDFYGCDFGTKIGRSPQHPEWGGDPSPKFPVENHGTAVAGIAAAFSDDNSNLANAGVVGICPKCRLMLIRYGDSLDEDWRAFSYAIDKGAAVISISWVLPTAGWTPPDLEPIVKEAANQGRGGRGIIVFAGMTNYRDDDCGISSPSLARLADVIAVSCSTNQDRHGSCGIGTCLRVLAPSGVNTTLNPGAGTANIATTDRTGYLGFFYNGYNDLVADSTCPREPGGLQTGELPISDEAYTQCFKGTSASTPLVAGLAGLVLAADPVLSRTEVQNLLQDTADRIEDDLANYDVTNGFSAPSSGLPTHGYGRVNAYEAVRVVAPISSDERGGRGVVDVFLRDNRLDWGNTEQPSSTRFDSPRRFIPFWTSPDIKVDAPPFQTPPTATSFDEGFADENPLAGQTNRIYVRVRNRGPRPAGLVTVKLDWAFAGTALPPLPADFWSTLHTGGSTDPTSKWHSLGTRTISDLRYSGSSVAGTTTDGAQVVEFDFPAPTLDLTQPSPSHYCVLAIADSPDDPVSPEWNRGPELVVDSITPWDNNVTHRNLVLVDASTTAAVVSFYVRNPYDSAIEALLRWTSERAWGPRLLNVGGRITVHVPVPLLPVLLTDGIDFNRPFRLLPHQELLVSMVVNVPREGPRFELTVTQERTNLPGNQRTVMGGMTYLIGTTE